MDTDKHGLGQLMAAPLHLIKTLYGVGFGFMEKPFLSVFICVYPWLKFFTKSFPA